MPGPLDLAVLEARWRLNELAPTDLHEVADRLLSDGVDSQALIDLFCLRPDELPWKGPELFELVLSDLGAGDLSPDRAVPVMAKWIASQVLNGSMRPADATSQAANLYVRTEYAHDELAGLYALDEEIHYLDRSGGTMFGRTYEVAADVRAEAHRLLSE